jgi:hypothetical protein
MSSASKPEYPSVTVHFDTAEALLRALSPLARGEFHDRKRGDGLSFAESASGTPPIWFKKRDSDHPKSGNGAREWLFRGLSNASYDGTPSGWRERPQSLLLKWLRADDLTKTSPKQLAFAEMHLLSDYFKKCDAQGLPIPGDCTALRSARPPRSPADVTGEWPTPEALPLLATIQHNLTNTRLLDLSRRPLVSAWFAASGHVAADDNKKADQIAIWCVRNAGPDTGEPTLLQRAGLKLYAPPRADNPNLHLQSGKMVYLPLSTEQSEGPTAERDYHKRITSAAETIAETTTTPSTAWVRRFVLPGSEAPALLSLLNAHFVHGARIYAGHHGISEAVKLDILSGRKHR